jgi:pyruvate kinase
LSMCWGVCPHRIEFSEDPNTTIETAAKLLRQQHLTSSGDNLIITSDVQAHEERIDCVQLRTAK